MHYVEIIYSGTDNIKWVLKKKPNISLTHSYINQSIIPDFMKTNRALNHPNWDTTTTYNLQQIGDQVLIEEETTDKKIGKQIYTITPEGNNNGICRPQKIKKSRKKLYECEICKAPFSNLRYLERHLFNHRKQTHIPCDICNKIFDSVTTKDKHIKRFHTCYHCTICNKFIKRLGHFRAHIKNHFVPNLFNCAICNNIYTSKYAYQYHMNKHTDISFECYICKKLLASRQTLKYHMSIHSGKNYRCTICGKIFRTSLYFKMHQLTHTDIKRYSCDICGKCFFNRCGVSKHTLYKHK